MQILLLALNSLLMIGLPIALAWLIHKRHGAAWRFFWIGAATFILSQILHIPFNAIFFSSISGWLEGLPEMTGIIISAVLLGLSAGVFEEGARYLTYRYWAKDARTWGRGLMLGAGHGGIEAVILGVIAGANLIFLSGIRAGYFQSLIPPEQMADIGLAAEHLFNSPWYDLLLGAFERLFTLFLHLSLSLLVMQVFTRGAIIWLFLAIGWHTLVDAGSVVALRVYGPYVTEGLVALAGAISLIIIYALKKPEPVAPPPEGLPEAGPAPPVDVPITEAKLDESKYI
jgi:uncharacterized membrane protein YhfC